jgi:hypothetical protein
MMMELPQLSMHRHPCHHQAGIAALVTMVLLPLIHDGIVALVTMVSLPSSSWHCPPHCNGIVVIIHVVALVTHCQARVVAVNAEDSLFLSRWQLLLSL